MKNLYTLLFCLSLTLINPWGLSRGEIWTQPKVLILVLICSVNLLILWFERKALKIPRHWKISKLLWELFLGIGLLSTFHSPFPIRSLFGQEQMGDGLLYWLLIAIFTLSNTLLLNLHPELLRNQVQGLLIGGFIVALSIFPQAIDWRIDYTATMGQLLKENILVSTIFCSITTNSNPSRNISWDNRIGLLELSDESSETVPKGSILHTIGVFIIYQYHFSQPQN